MKISNLNDEKFSYKFYSKNKRILIETVYRSFYIKLTSKTKVICTTVGPYAKLGTRLKWFK